MGGIETAAIPKFVVVHGMLFTYHIRWSIYPFRDHCPMNTSHPWKFANICQHLPASTGSSGLWHVATHHQVIPVLALPQLRRRHARQSRALRGVAQVRWCAPCWVLLSEVNDICSVQQIVANWSHFLIFFVGGYVLIKIIQERYYIRLRWWVKFESYNLAHYVWPWGQ